jgi:hypothetical protein
MRLRAPLQDRTQAASGRQGCNRQSGFALLGPPALTVSSAVAAKSFYTTTDSSNTRSHDAREKPNEGRVLVLDIANEGVDSTESTAPILFRNSPSGWVLGKSDGTCGSTGSQAEHPSALI